MKMLLISEDTALSPSYFKMFEGDYIESKSDVSVKYSVQDAKDFLTDIIIKGQKHLDFIIADYTTKTFEDELNKLTEWLRHTKETYSVKNFRLRSLPFFVMNREIVTSIEDFLFSNNTQNLKYHDGVIVKPDDFSQIGINNNKLAEGLDTWLDNLKSDLDDLDIDSAGEYILDLKLFERRAYKLRVLSEFFHVNKTRLDYIWVGNNTNIVESTGEQILRMLKQYERNRTYRNEKAIHDMLKENSHLLKGEDYYKSLYEKHFYVNEGRGYVESDFINFTYKYSLAKDEIFEIKLPSERFVTRTKIPRILKKANRYFSQVGSKYNNYFSSELNADEITKRLNEEGIDIFSKEFTMSLLMGREIDRQQNLELINQGLVFGDKSVKLVTYDNLIDRHHYLHQRVKRFGIN